MVMHLQTFRSGESQPCFRFGLGFFFKGGFADFQMLQTFETDGFSTENLHAKSKEKPA